MTSAIAHAAPLAVLLLPVPARRVEPPSLCTPHVHKMDGWTGAGSSSSWQAGLGGQTCGGVDLAAQRGIASHWRRGHGLVKGHCATDSPRRSIIMFCLCIAAKCSYPGRGCSMQGQGLI